jgi:hypothetical protein
MAHGVVTSPHYPNYYPNEDRECKYLIDPNAAGVQIVTLSVLDINLESSYGEILLDLRFLPKLLQRIEKR